MSWQLENKVTELNSILDRTEEILKSDDKKRIKDFLESVKQIGLAMSARDE